MLGLHLKLLTKIGRMDLRTKLKKKKKPNPQVVSSTSCLFKTRFLCVAQAGLELGGPPASASQVSGLQVCIITVQMDYLPPPQLL